MKRFYLGIMALLIVASPLVAPFSQPASAVTAADWSAGRIIDDIVFTDGSSMSVGDIQSFLNTKVPACDTWGTKPSEYGGGTRAEYAASRGYSTPFTCLKDYYEVPKTSPGPQEPASNYGGAPIPTGAQSAAQIIANAAVKYRISPKVLLVKLATESPGPLTSDDWPFKRQYLYAMGAHCPDSGPGGAANCDSNWAGFSLQMDEAAALMRWYLDSMQESWWQYKKPYQNNHILWNVVERGCGGSNVYIESKATAALYTYTPYQPNAAALNNMYTTGDNCSAYGNRNFWRVFRDWFGNTHGTVYGGIDYSAVFNGEYYLSAYSDVHASFGDNQSRAFDHFMQYGINEGRQANADFSVTSYRNRYSDLRWYFGTTLKPYYHHFISDGKREGRTATGDIALTPVTSRNGINYATVYSYSSYLNINTDMQRVFSNDDTGALRHFTDYGMNEARVASSEFSVESYRNRYVDLRRSFDGNLRAYYMHYITTGKSEGRTATGEFYGGTSILNGVDYSSVYNFDTYMKTNGDVKNAFGVDDIKAIQHFVNYGMSEGRIASAEFNVGLYKQRNPDLQQAFGSNLKSYYLHYMYYGKKEGRVAN